VQTSQFLESRHPLVVALGQQSDSDLLTLFQRYPDKGQYFVAIFCRYTPIVQSLIRHSVRSPVQADYLFALTWRHIFNEMGGLDLRDRVPPGQPPQSLQSWLINTTAACINSTPLPPVESIHYSLQENSPPLWCYLEQALNRLEPVHRLMILMAQTFHWSESRISAYLQAEGEMMSPAEVKAELDAAYPALEAALPDDIGAIYLDRLPRRPSLVAEELGLEENWFDLPSLSLES
jgi:hypothetical protein